MFRNNTNLAKYIYEKLQIGGMSPDYNVKIRRKNGVGGFEDFPFYMKNIRSISIDRRYNMNCDSCSIEFENTNGYMSPDYSTNKKFTNVGNLPKTGYRSVIMPFNWISVDLGYGDEIRRIFTGGIDSIDINENPASLKVECRNNLRFLKKPIDPVVSRNLVYEDRRAVDICSDLLKRSGINTFVVDYESVAGFDFAINKAEFELGTEYLDAVSTILDSMNHRIYADRLGIVRIERKKINTQRDFHVFEVSDYVNMTQGSYMIDSSVIRNRVIVQSENSWRAYEDPFLIDYCNDEVISSGLEVPWAESDEQKWAVADSYFLDMRRKLRRINIGIIGNPTLDVGDLIKMEALTSTALGKYVITAIQTSFSASGYIDVLDLEFVTSGEHIAVEAEGDYSNTSDDGESQQAAGLVVDKRDEVVIYALGFLGAPYQWNGDALAIIEDYGFDSSHFVYEVYKKFGLMDAYIPIADLYASVKKIEESELLKGDIVFYTNENGVVNHCGVYVGDGKVVSASGGDESVNTVGIARAMNACIKVHLLRYKGDSMLCGRLL